MLGGQRKPGLEVSTMNRPPEVQLPCFPPPRNTWGWVTELAPRVSPSWPRNCLNPSPLPNQY